MILWSIAPDPSFRYSFLRLCFIIEVSDLEQRLAEKDIEIGDPV
jgi:hypothetical protein